MGLVIQVNIFKMIFIFFILSQNMFLLSKPKLGGQLEDEQLVESCAMRYFCGTLVIYVSSMVN